MRDYLFKNAEISQCEQYRYRLTRKWEQTNGKRGLCTFIMLNPSTADGNKDDATIRKCVQFADRNMCNNLLVVNLFAYRVTDSDALKLLSDKGVDIIGPKNNMTLSQAMGESTLVIAGWGKKAHVQDRHTWAMDFLKRSNRTVYCLTLNEDGTPAHPLYQPYDRRLVKFL